MSNESILSIIKKLAADQEAANGVVRIPKTRDHVDCRFCGGGSASLGRGCMACYNARQKKIKELDEEYNRQFPNGPEPIFTAKLEDKEQMDQAREVIGRKAIEKAFGPGGGGIDEVVANCEKAMKERENK